jgi:hypothetical protein
MMKEGKQIFDLLLIQIHSAQLADPFCWGRSAQHNGWNVCWEPFPKRTESPEAVTEFNLDKAVPIEFRRVFPSSRS